MREGTLVNDRYKVLSLLGKGGAAAVYGVIDTAKNDRRLAMKQLTLKGRAGDAHELRFRREFHTMAGLVHPNIVEVYDYGIAPEGPFYTMELLEGEDLRAMSGCPIDTACRLLRDVASALALLHARRLLHRDVGPRNARCSGDGAAKLIDFGVLATTGVAGELAGTPPCVPPEAVRLLPLDHKADLYGLGALAYWLLTGRHAYPAKTFFELEGLWTQRPARPSELRPDVPPALDDLVLSLLSLDPLGRPARAAEVIDRLVAIGGLDPTTESEAEAGRGYLLSATLVGRQEELSLVRAAVQKAAQGHGGALLFEAPLGAGKSRLLREVSLEAQLAGMSVVLASNDTTSRGPYGLLRALVLRLVQLLPNEIPRIALPRAPILYRVLPEVLPAPQWEGVKIEPPAGDPRQDRMRLQAALVGLFVDIAARHRLAILVDDVHLADEGSAAVLASLAHAARDRSLLLALTLASDEPVHAKAAVGAIQDVAARARLRGLSIADVEQLAGAVFGDVPHARLSKWLHDAAGGNPMRVLDLARHLIDRGIVRYAAGLWVIPEELPAAALPPGLAEAMDRKIASLSPAARALAEALSLHGGDLPLGLCVALADSSDEAAVFGAIDELVFEEVLIGWDDRYRFRHQGLRDALRRGLDEARRKSLHLRVGEALMALAGVTAPLAPAGGDGASLPELSDGRDADVGWHLYHGGERSRAAPLLASAARRLHAAQSFRDAVPLLEAALSVYEAEDRPPETCLELRHMLMIAGVMCDRAVLLRYAAGTFAELRRYGGADVGERLARRIGAKLGLVLGVLIATLRFHLTPRARRGPSPISALTTLGVLVTATATAYSLAFDLDGLRELLRHIELFRAFPDRAPHAAYLLCQCLLGIPLGRWRSVQENANKALAVFARTAARNPFDRKNGIAAAHYMLASGLASDQNPSFEHQIEQMKRQDLRFFDVSAEMVRLFYHRFRGEEEQARAMEAKTELLFVQLGSMWLIQSQLPWVSGFAYAVTHDALGLKRCIEDLSRLCKAGYRFEPFLEIARGEYYRERGRLDAAHAAISRALAMLPEEELFRRQRALAALAEVLLSMGRFADAKRTAEEAFALACDPEIVHVTWRMRCGRVVALALAANGEHAAAARRVDDLLREMDHVQSPSMSGALHETRAQIALLAGDRAAYERHLAETERWFRPTKNPALVARCERLIQAGAAGRGPDAREMAAAATTRPEGAALVAAAFKQCTSPAERASRAVELLLSATSGSQGYLYLCREGELGLAFATTDAEPPAELHGLLERALETADDEGATVVQPGKGAGDAEPLAWMPVVLAIHDEADSGSRPRRREIVGAAAILQGAIPLEPPAPSLVEAIAAELREDEDVTTAVVIAGLRRPSARRPAQSGS
jgi:tetratricopeptide (TPR) repeat protein